MPMILKLCLILGLLAVAAWGLNRLFPAREDQDRPRTFNDVMADIDYDDLETVSPAGDEAESGAVDEATPDGDD